MCTLKQQNANRANAQKSTGPVTPEGKSVVALNAVKHGLRSSTTVLPGEDQEEFDHRLQTAYTNWNPINNYEDSLCLQLVRNDWYMARAHRALEELLSADLSPLEHSVISNRICLNGRHPLEATGVPRPPLSKYSFRLPASNASTTKPAGN